MAELTPDQRETLEKCLASIDKVMGELDAYVKEYAFPYTYTKFRELAERQRIAIGNMLETGDPGCDVGSLELDNKSMLAVPHLANLAFISREALKLDEPERGEFSSLRQKVLHDIKNFSSAPMLAHWHIKKIVGSRGAGDTKLEQAR